MPIEDHGSRRERAVRTLTFWLRPAFALRVLHRFQRMAGFDRAVALASSALTALIPLAVVSGVILRGVGIKDFADRIIDRYELTGGGAESVRDIFSPAGTDNTSLGVIGAVLLLVAVLSFTRAVQRVFEQAWELPGLSVRNTLNGARWAVVLLVFLPLVGWLHTVVDFGRLDLIAALVLLPLTGIWLMWSGRILSAKRISWPDLLPFGVIASSLFAAFSIGATIYVPHLFDSYATRYGVIGAVFAMISTLFCITVILVGSAALGREVSDELAQIRRGERPPENEVRREWDKVTAEARSRWGSARDRLGPRLRPHRPPRR
jgi:membrane protein